MPLREENERRGRLLHETSVDVGMQMQQQREWWERSYPLVGLLRINREETNVDELYQEARDWTMQAPIDVRCHPEHGPSTQRLKKYGIESTREVVFSFSTLLLDDQGLLERSRDFLIGAIVKWDGDLYEILSQHRGKDGYWLQTGIPMYLECTANQYRPGK